MELFMLLFLMVRLRYMDEALLLEFLGTPPHIAFLLNLGQLFAIYGMMEDLSNAGRLFWMYPRSSHWWEEIVRNVWRIDTDHNLTKDSYLEYFGMKISLFEDLVDQIEPYMPPPSDWALARERIPLPKVFAMVLFRFASASSLKVVSNRFGVGRSTIVKYTRIIVKILVTSNNLYLKYVGIPKGERLVDIIDGFEHLSSLPMIMGAIDGTHIPLRAKPNRDDHPADYWCHKGFHSILFQGICDHNRIFWSMTYRTTGSQADSTQLRTSKVWSQLNDEQLWEAAPRLRLVDGLTLRPCLVGDSAYPFRPWLLKKFNVHRADDKDRAEFNTCHSKARVLIENAFGNLKIKWKITGKMTVDLQDVPSTPVACGVLHNFIKMRGIPLRDEDRVAARAPIHPVLDVDNRRKCHQLREALLQHWLNQRRALESETESRTSSE